MYAQLFGKIYREHYVQRSTTNAKQTDGLARPAAKVPSCKPAFLLPTLTAVDRTSSGKILPAVCLTPRSKLSNRCPFHPHPSHFGRDQANNPRLCNVVRGQVGEESSPGSNTSPLSGGLEAQGVDIDKRARQQGANRELAVGSSWFNQHAVVPWDALWPSYPHHSLCIR